LIEKRFAYLENLGIAEAGKDPVMKAFCEGYLKALDFMEESKHSVNDSYAHTSEVRK
jgi:hypothetical protein